MKRTSDIRTAPSEPKMITPAEAVEILKKHGHDFTVEQATKILEFMDRLAKIAIQHYVK